MPTTPIALQVQPPGEIPNPLEQFGKYLTLRQMLENQKYRQLQAEESQFELGEKRAAAGRAQSFREMLGRADVTDKELIAADPDMAYKLIKSREDQEKARREAVTAGLTQDKTRAELEAKRLEKYGNDMYSLRLVPPEKRPQAFQDIVTEYVNSGDWTPEQAAEHEGKGPPGDDELDPLMVRAFGSKEVLLRQKAEIEKRIAELSETAAQQKIAGKEPIQPVQQAQLDKPPEEVRAFQAFAPKYYGAKGIVNPTPADELAAYKEFQTARHPVQPTAGQMFTKSPAVVAQELDIERQKHELQNQSNLNKAMSGESAKVYSIASTIEPDLNSLREAFRKDYKGTLRGIILGTNPHHRKLMETAADKVGRMRSGGAVNKDEEKRFSDQIASKADLMFGNLDATLAALDRYSLEAKTIEGNLRPRRGGPAAATKHDKGSDPGGIR